MYESLVYIASNPSIVFLVGMPLAIAMFLVYRKCMAMKTAQWIVEEGQFEHLPEDHLDAAIQEAEKNGYKDSFIQLLTLIRRHHGHDGVKIGHLYWIWEQIENGNSPDNIVDVPGFIK